MQEISVKNAIIETVPLQYQYKNTTLSLFQIFLLQGQ